MLWGRSRDSFLEVSCAVGLRDGRKLESLGLGRAVCLEFCGGSLDYSTLLLSGVLRTGAGLNGSSLGPVQHRA